jgi:drug/metabolite transporter (DMT)-like permease
VAFADALDLASRKELTGDLLALLAAMLWAGATVLIKGGRLARANASKTLFYQLAVSAVLLAAASLVRGEDWAIRPSRLALACMAFQVVIVAWLSYHAWFWLVRHYPAGLLTAFTFLTPLFGVLAGGLLLRERLSGWLGAALALVSAGLYLVNRPPPVQPAPAGKTVPGA